MRRREFLAAVAAAGLTPARTTASTPFPVHYKRPNPFDAVLRYVEPGSDEFKAERMLVIIGCLFCIPHPKFYMIGSV